MLARIRYVSGIIGIAMTLAMGASAQPVVPVPEKHSGPSNPMRPYIVLPAQSLSDLEQTLRSDNKVVDLIGGEGMQLRVAVQHDKSKPTATAELHDASDDVYYVLDGTAALTLGGKLDAPKEIEPGEWRSATITGGKTFQITKGDLIVVPRGTPHHRTGKDFSLILIKIYALPLPAPKPATPATTPTPTVSPTPAATPTPPAKPRTPTMP